MKEEILKRAMFAMPLSKDARNSGIMSGFDMDEMDEMPEPSEASEEMPQMSRTPQNPEILMNNLRGDMRSVDARYMELAQMVGEEAAMETPPEVLAMLQLQLGQQGGIGALPQAQGMAPAGAPGGMPQPPQPQGGMPPGMGGGMPPFSGGGAEEAPQQLADGGAVTGSGGLDLHIPLNFGGGGAGGQFGGQFGGLGSLVGNQSDMMAQMKAQMKAASELASQKSLISPQWEGPTAAPHVLPIQNQELGPAVQMDSGNPFHAFASQGPNALQSLQSLFGGFNTIKQQAQQQAQQQATSAPALFAKGGEVAPPTPDGMPPMHAFLGAFATPAARLAQFGADKMGALNAATGQMMSRGFPQQFPAIMENLRGPGGRFTAEQVLKYPTLTQHLSNLVGPTATTAAQRTGSMMAPALATGATVIGASGVYKGAVGDQQATPERQELVDTFERLYYEQPGMDRSVPMPSLTNRTNEQLLADVTTMTNRAEARAATPTTAVGAGAAKAATPAPAAPAAEAPAAEAPAEKTTTDFIKANIAAPSVETAKSRIDRIREAKAEYAPLYKELLGDTKDDMYTNAMLLLADAGFKYAQLPAGAGTTPASLFATAVSGVPQGFMALLAQARDNKIKVDTAALSQAVSDVQEQDKYAQQLKLELLKGDYRLLAEQIKQGGGTVKDGGAGLLIAETKGGGYKGVSIDPNNPTVQSAVSSRFTLRPTDNPFVENRGEAPTTVETDKEQRTKLTSTLRSLDNSLSTLDNLKGLYVEAYGPGAWFSDKVNNLLVPWVPTALVRPDVNLTDASTRISTGMNSILKNIASANDNGRVAVQEQEWARDTAKGISDPTKFFADKELAAKQFNSMEAMLRNARQQVLTQLGYEKNDFVMNTPNTGTKSDPFVIPSDPDAQKRMFNFLGSTIGKVQDPRATVYMRMPNGTIQSASPIQLRGLMQ